MDRNAPFSGKSKEESIEQCIALLGLFLAFKVKRIQSCVLLSRDNERPRTAEPLRQFPSAYSALQSAKKCNLRKSHCLHQRLELTFLENWAKIFKKIQAKKLVKSTKSISRKNFLSKFHFFVISKMAKNQFLNQGKSLKLTKMKFHEKIFLI